MGQKLINRIAFYREQAGGMSQEGLAIRVGTSQQQISRIENGQSTNISMARAIAQALDKPLELIFPDIGEDPIRGNIEAATAFHDRAQKAGLRFGGEPINWRVYLRMRGVVELFEYILEHREAERVHVYLEDRLHKVQRLNTKLVFESNFLAINPQGRFVAINADDIVSVGFEEWDQACELNESFVSTRVFLRGEPDPVVIDEADDLRDHSYDPPIAPLPSDEQYKNWGRWKCALVDSPVAFQFIQIHNFTNDEDMFFNINDIVVVEVPTRSLIEELFREEWNAQQEAEEEMFQSLAGMPLEEYLEARRASGLPNAEFDAKFFGPGKTYSVTPPNGDDTGAGETGLGDQHE